MESAVYNQTGKETGTIKLPEAVFNVAWNDDLVHQVAVSMMGNDRQPIAHAKNRGEVSGTGKKPWKQKGTGRARHGSRRSPIWVGGGAAHGPRNDRNYDRKINKKMKVQALFSVLSKKLKDNQLVFVDKISFPAIKTKEAKAVFNSLSKIKELNGMNRSKNAAYIALGQKDETLRKSFRNLGNLELGEVKDINILDALKYKFLIISDPDKSLAILQKKIA